MKPSAAVSTLSRRKALTPLTQSARPWINQKLSQISKVDFLKKSLKFSQIPKVDLTNKERLDKVVRVVGGGKNNGQRFATSSLVKNPTGVEASWEYVANNPSRQNNSMHDKTMTTLYHSSKDDALKNAERGWVLATDDITWHHTMPTWRFFGKHEKVRAEILVPSSILKTAIAAQTARIDGDLPTRIKGQSTRALAERNIHYHVSNMPIVTRYSMFPNVAPHGIPNGKTYATVVMPPFRARVVEKVRPDRVTLQFLGFRDARLHKKRLHLMRKNDLNVRILEVEEELNNILEKQNSNINTRTRLTKLQHVLQYMRRARANVVLQTLGIPLNTPPSEFDQVLQIIGALVKSPWKNYSINLVDFDNFKRSDGYNLLQRLFQGIRVFRERQTPEGFAYFVRNLRNNHVSPPLSGFDVR
jgi:hypothetical protein